MGHHLVVGAGGIGRSVTAHLVALGHTVTLASRSGRVTQRPWEQEPGGTEAVTVVAADAGDAERLVQLARGADSIVNAVNPPSYDRWDADWPPVAAALLEAAERTAAALVVIGNLYQYGEVAGPMTEWTPLAATGSKGRLRADMWLTALEAQRAGRVRVTELRSSDYVGPGATRMTSYLGDVVVDRVAAGGRALMPVGRTDVPHTWTYIPDVGRFAALVCARAGEGAGSGAESGSGTEVFGRPWHVPSPAARTVQEAADDVARLTGHRPRRVLRLPRPVGTALGLVIPFFREVRETRHQFERPFVLDASEAERVFGFTATPWEQVLTETIADRVGPEALVGRERAASGA
ncbi:nucleoside-diphosphate-sugar epimerase [Terracoccus luteus]|uniref:Nucleoside-diphosphate-sugar epimerase n=1 Tax=Terracoccus luteus TaxID=53356 RepID=A0A495XYI3_9MICO|nr:NAD-dependent epimerase/dehydratase family protein [Terracoccus luteus]RKT79671.1 nucleoside-diphosphate-sugar epimerase [Terracoccus luteus]